MAFYIIEFIVMFVFTYFFYHNFFIKRNYKKNITPIELSYLKNKYNLDIKKIDKKVIGIQISLLNAFVIASSITVIGLVEDYLLKIFVGFIYLIILTVFTYYLLGIYYKKRGLTKNV